jgi:hypothetical protein
MRKRNSSVQNFRCPADTVSSGLSALVIVPSICLQLSSAAVSGGSELDLRNALAGPV